MNFDWQAIVAVSAPWAVLVIVLIYFIKNPEKVEKWGSIVARTFSFASERLEKRSVAGDIQSDINSFAEEVNAQTKDPLLPYKVRVKWIKSTTREAFVTKRKVVVRMRHHENQAKNFLYVTMEWVSKALIPEARHLLDKTVLRAADLIFVNNLLTKKKRHDVKQLFLDEIYEPEVTKGSTLERYCSTFGKLSETGLFAGVALQEFDNLGKRMGNSLPDKRMRSETIGFMNMLEKLAKKKPGVDVNPNYEGDSIKCSVVLIARQETYFIRGLSPYLSWINRCCERGIRSIYVCAIEDANIMIVRKIKDAYEESKKLAIVSEKIFPMNAKKAIVLRMELAEEA